MLKRTLPLWLLPAAALGLFGCPDEELAPLEPCTVSGVVKDVATTGVDKVDLLFMIDNSGSMSEEQKNIAKELPRLVQILTSGDLQDGGSAKDFQPVSSLQLGVISSDMGTDGAYPLCKGDGDDGILINKVTASTYADCAGNDFGTSSYLAYSPEDSKKKPEEIATTFGCVAALGTKGCGFEQQLEAVYKALAPSTATGFVSGKAHGTGKNKGFVRDDAVLAVILVTDEEDCSITKEGHYLFDPGSKDERLKYDGEPADLKGQIEGLNFRCGYESTQDESSEALQPVSRYVDGLIGLKAENPDRVIYAAITGIPQDAEEIEVSSGVQDFTKILAMDEMQIFPGDLTCNKDQMADKVIGPKCGTPQVDGPTPPLPRPACTGPGGSASPARRIVGVAEGFAKKGQGANAIVRSICRDDFSSALDSILKKIADVLTGACLPRPLNRNNKGMVTCDVIEILKEGATEADCKASKGRIGLGETRMVDTVDGPQARAACKVNQVPVIGGKLADNPSPLPGTPKDVGWYYDDFSAEVQDSCQPPRYESAQRITTTPGAELADEASFKFECFQPVGGNISAEGRAAVGAPCGSSADGAKCKSDDQYNLVCEELSNTCQIKCESDAQCPKPWICDTSFETPICNNPTCPSGQ
jgi:hypothetical protein